PKNVYVRVFSTTAKYPKLYLLIKNYSNILRTKKLYTSAKKKIIKNKNNFRKYKIKPRTLEK
ncbi:UNVERIFIED_CONTAM: hypothetical protein NY100_23850, partial [Prevotella sp. 15_C9]